MNDKTNLSEELLWDKLAHELKCRLECELRNKKSDPTGSGFNLANRINMFEAVRCENGLADSKAATEPDELRNDLTASQVILINDLLQQVVANGIVTTAQAKRLKPFIILAMALGSINAIRAWKENDGVLN